jgi:glyoxylase-like metal-dependent hydrolase (beta-lactamase superfamily II)
VTPASPADWTYPGPVPVAPGVHRIPLPMPSDGLRAVNVYALQDGTGITLIDGGWVVPEARAALAQALDQLGFGLRGIRRILVTHAHRDHYTLAIALRRDFGMPVGLGAGERASIAAITGRVNRFAAQVSLLREAGAAELADRIGDIDSEVDPAAEAFEEPDEWLDAGSMRVGDRMLRVVPTPGHTSGHLAFADAGAGLLFAGDHVLPHITPSIGFEAAPSPTALSDFLGSLATVSALPDLTLLPAHGPHGGSTHDRVRELVTHHDERLAETTAVVAGLGPATAAAVAGALGWTRRRRSFASLDPFNQMLAVTETVAHLQLLVQTGVLAQTGPPAGGVASVAYYEVARPAYSG